MVRGKLGRRFKGVRTGMSNAYTIERPYENLARTISDVTSPPVLAIPGLILAVVGSDVPGTYRFAMVYFILGVIGPVVYVLWLLKSGRIDDFHLPVRKDRIRPFLASLFCSLLAISLIIAFDAPSSFLAPVVALFLQTSLLFGITLVWQISVHTATVAGMATFAVLALGPLAAVFLPLVPLVAWARVYLGRHTVSQCIAGASLGCLCFLGLFAMRGWIW